MAKPTPEVKYTTEKIEGWNCEPAAYETCKKCQGKGEFPDRGYSPNTCGDCNGTGHSETVLMYKCTRPAAGGRRTRNRKSKSRNMRKVRNTRNKRNTRRSMRGGDHFCDTPQGAWKEMGYESRGECVRDNN